MEENFIQRVRIKLNDRRFTSRTFALCIILIIDRTTLNRENVNPIFTRRTVDQAKSNSLNTIMKLNSLFGLNKYLILGIVTDVKI